MALPAAPSSAGTRIVLPLGFIVALLFARAYAGEALTLMASRLVGRPSAAAVEQLVRQVLDDPLARLAFWLPRRERFVDRHGNTVVLDAAEEGKTWRAFGHGETHVLAILHEPILGEDPELVGAVGATALLILENRRLEQDLLDSVGALRASQRRLVAAASSERRKIERDLHDGVQQTLVALRIQLELALELADEESRLAEQPREPRGGVRRWRSTSSGRSRTGSIRRCWPTPGSPQPCSTRPAVRSCR